MIIIVEGSNKVGKSSIIEKLKKMHNIKAIYNRSINNLMKDRKQESYMSAITMLDMLDNFKDHNIILDRFHLSEMVYGEVDRGYKNYGMISIDMELSKRDDILLILVTSDYNHIPDSNLKLRYEYIQEKFVEKFKASEIKNKIMIKLEDIV